MSEASRWSAHATSVFLPLTTDAAADLARTAPTPARRALAAAVLAEAERAERAADRCWTALLAGCDAPSGPALDARLRLLSDATSQFVGTRWWFADGSAHRRRVAGAQSHIGDAIMDGDGQEFAQAFVGYDHAIASAVVCADTRTGSRTP